MAASEHPGRHDVDPQRYPKRGQRRPDPGAVQFGAYVAPEPGFVPRTVTPFGGERELNLYAFEVYALDQILTIDPNATMTDLQAAMKGHVVAYGVAPPGGAASPAGAPPAGN